MVRRPLNGWMFLNYQIKAFAHGTGMRDGWIGPWWWGGRNKINDLIQHDAASKIGAVD